MRIIIPGLFGLVCGLGCQSEVPPPPVLPSAVYPLRTDWLVSNAPGVQPTRPAGPGRFPLSVLDRPLDPNDADARALFAEKAKNIILDPRLLAAEDRDGLQAALPKLFGTPAAPRVEPIQVKWADQKVDVNAELGLDELTLAQGSRLYQQHCQLCHGEAGNGRGPAATAYRPPPRDYRQGKFKFISTVQGGSVPPGRPRRTDLYRTLVEGIGVGGMPSFRGLSETELQALVSYVIHLSLRGESEFNAIKEAIQAGLDVSAEDKLREGLQVFAASWIAAEHQPVQPDPDPYTTPDLQLQAARDGARIYQQMECAKCHVNYGRNSPYYYDIWGTIVQPRNLTTGQWRGGRRAVDLYYRFSCGIVSCGMPSYADKLRPSTSDKEQGVDRLWQLVHFVETIADRDRRELLQRRYGVRLD